jgi:DNA-binding transcriptional ArsR family regulator
VATKKNDQKEEKDKATRYADMFAALGSEPRLQIMRLLLSAHPDGMVAGEIQNDMGASPSTLSHHLDKLRRQGLITMTRERTYLRYRASTETLQELLTFLYSECCTRTSVVDAREIFRAR